MRPNTTASATPANGSKSETRPAQNNVAASPARPFPVSNTNMGTMNQSDQIRAALDTLGIKLIKSEAERDVLKKLVEETRATQARLERELLENRKELADTKRRMDEQKQETELAKGRQERLEEKLRETQASSLKISRRIETDEQKRTRMQRRMDRLETIAEEAQNALQSRAMVLLTDAAMAEKTGLPSLPAAGPALPPPLTAQGASSMIGSTGDIISLDGDGNILPWWKRPLNLNASVAAVAVIVALGLGWAFASSTSNDSNAIAFMADGSLAKIDLKKGTLEPLQLQLKKLDESALAPSAEAPSVTPNGEPLPPAKPDPAAPSETELKTPASAPAKDETLTGSLSELQDKAYAGVAEAQHDLAAIYTAGSGVKQDYARASYWFHQAADSGVANAAYNLGVLHHQGLGVDKNIQTALDWYRVAALEGHPEAQYNLGIAYIEGIGTKYNPQLAAGFFQKAALSGITEAAYNLGLILENGLLAEPKPNQALMWYRVGSEGGSVEAKNALEQLSTRLGLDPAKAGFLPDGSSLSKLVVKPERTDTSIEDNTAQLAKLLPDLAEMIPDSDQLMTAQIQEQLARRDMYDGAQDGAMSSKTIDAIKSYEKDRGLKVDGKATEELLMALLKESTALDATGGN